MSAHKTLLIVDDSFVSRMMIKSLVAKKQPDWTLLEAADGASALEMSQKHQIDYFSIDLNMPGMNGIELIRQLKPDNLGAHMALLTANIQESTHKKAALLGVKCIHKPITEESIDEMLETLK